ncbi:D-alanyl-D-alanine carboxypeptidase family protein [Nitratireductor rhodophyticola]|uniref:D-alanyl-D-alanine carboxypeptidase family protein n=1 Tax=Nitratireductor rhodophyticola TaxID=2854036 RepID=UPI003BACE4BA
MVRVPEYQRNVSLRPSNRADYNVRASADAFGASAGRGLTQFAQGVSNLAGSFEAVRELEDIASAKEADNAFAEWSRERMYGEGGFMTLEGRNAVHQRATFEEEAEQKRKEFGANLTPGAARAYQKASTARLQSVYQQSIVHTANARKSWFKDASAARVSTFADDALVNFNNPALVTKNIAAGLMEIREAGAMAGWGEDTLKQREAEFVSGIHKNITLRLAQSDPLAADAYRKKHKDALSGSDQYALENSLATEIRNEQSKREAAAILGSSRGQAGTTPTVGRNMGQAGPTQARAFLQSRSNKAESHVDGLDENFATNLAALIQDAPPGIREGLGIYSGYRSVDHQRQLWENALKKYGSASAARKWVAPPGRSNHNHGQAVDLSYNGQSLARAPKDVRDWVHANARNYGMYFPMEHEPWHIEPMGTRGTEPASGTVAPRNQNIAPRSVMPSFDEIEDRLQGIADPEVREMTRKRIYAALAAQDKAAQAQEKAAKAELWKYIDQGATPDQVPMEVRQAAGMSAVSSAWNYLETAAKGREIESDETLLYDMRRYAAANPTDFAQIDLNEYRDRLSKEAIKELTGRQTDALSDQRKAREDGLTLTTAFSQATSQLEAVGITTVGKDGARREEAAKRIAQFQNALAMEMEAFKQANEGKNPNQIDIQSMVSRLLLPVVIKEPGMLWGTNDRDGFLFETGLRSDTSTVDMDVQYADIPIDLRRGIARDLERELGRKPSEDEVVERYEDFALNQ